MSYIDADQVGEGAPSGEDAEDLDHLITAEEGLRVAMARQ
jgi:hypothetical protein